MSHSALLADCAAAGIHLSLAGPSDLAVDAPAGALMPDLVGRLKAVKADLLAMLHRAATQPAAATAPVCRCGSTITVDIPIHAGESTRRDCGRCGRFIGFPVWHGRAVA